MLRILYCFFCIIFIKTWKTDENFSPCRHWKLSGGWVLGQQVLHLICMQHAERIAPLFRTRHRMTPPAKICIQSKWNEIDLPLCVWLGIIIIIYHPEIPIPTPNAIAIPIVIHKTPSAAAFNLANGTGAVSFAPTQAVSFAPLNY